MNGSAVPDAMPTYNPLPKPVRKVRTVEMKSSNTTPP
jgi:hypothetical protein